MNKDKKGIMFFVRISLTLALIAGIIAGLLAAVNLLTKDKIAENKKKSQEEAAASVFGDGIECISEEFPEDDIVTLVYRVKKDGEDIGYAVYASPVGYGGNKIEMLVGLDSSGEIIKTVIIKDNQTAGIGDKVKGEDFLAGFNGATEDSLTSVATISGATKSSTGVKNGIKSVLALGLGKEGK